MPRDLGKRTPKSEMEKHGPAWGLNPSPDWKVMALHKKGMTAEQIAKELGTTSTYVEGTIARLSNPRTVRIVEARPAFKFAHEVIIPEDKLPKGTTIRSITVGDHVLRIASYGKVIGKTAAGQPKHEHSEIQSVLHPREPGKCHFVDELRKSGKLKELLEKGRMPIKNITPWSGGKVQYLHCPICQTQNPVSRVNLRMRCSKCGTQLLSVHVTKNIRRNYETRRSNR